VPDLNQWLTENLWLVVVLLALILIGLVGWIFVLGRRLERATAAYRSLADEASGRSLGELFVEHGARVDSVDARLRELDERYGRLEGRSRGSLQHIGLVRFNPFADTGSDQSFAIALLDDERNGLVLSSLHGRAGTRVFAKPIHAGQSTHALSDEEEQALAMAASGIGKTPSERDR
jgi:cbb3-type cytochrome oxidase subunit 3